jgi:hypothetical protein
VLPLRGPPSEPFQRQDDDALLPEQPIPGNANTSALPRLDTEPKAEADAPDSSHPASGEPGSASRPDTGGYRCTDLHEAGFRPDAERFYDPLHQSAIRAMVRHVLDEEAPIYADLLVQRIARAHGFARAASRIRETVLAAAGTTYPATTDDDRPLLWRPTQDRTGILPFRGPSPARDHGDIPIIELAGLATGYLDDGADREEAVRCMAQALDLRQLRAATRARLERAVDLAIDGSRL